MRKLFLLLSMLCLLVGCANKEPVFKEQDTIKIAVATDVHYFAKENYEQCDWFEEAMLHGDGKMVSYCDEIVDAFIDDVIAKEVDLVILTGDLTFDGDANSHKQLAQKLQKLKDNGIAVAAIAGNHDIDNIFTKGYGAEDYFDVENVSAAEFKKIYGNLGYDIAASEHKESLSYEVVLNDKYSLMVIDSNMHELTTGTAFDGGGRITESTNEWLVKCLDDAKKNNRIPIVAMHHNLGVHNELLNAGYTIHDNEEVIELFKSYNIPLVLSGHIHLQSIIDVDGIKEVVTSSLLDNPLQYGIVEMSDNNISYQSQQLTISVDSAEYFDTVSRNNFLEEETGKEAELKREVMTLVNRHYFAGTIKDIKDQVKKMEGYSLIMKEKDGFSKSYLESMLKNDGVNTKLEIKIEESK